MRPSDTEKPVVQEVEIQIDKKNHLKQGKKRKKLSPNILFFFSFGETPRRVETAG